jgi:hypothetical protein
MKKNVILMIIFFGFNWGGFAGDYEIALIKPLFNPSTPYFGHFKIQVGIKNNTDKLQKIAVNCLYTGLTHPGVYYKDEPKIIKQYIMLEIGPLNEKQIIFGKGFQTFHPDTAGEIIVSIVGTGVVRSFPLKTRFCPGNQD